MKAAASGTAFWRRFWPVWLAGFVGVLALALQPPPAALLERAPELRTMPPLLLQLAMLANPLVLMTVLCAAGAATAHRVGLASILAGTAAVRPPSRAWFIAAACGLALAAAITAADFAWAPSIGPAWQEVLRQSSQQPAVSTLLVGAAYGGLAEEVMMRWGVMGLAAWVLARLAAAGGGPGAWVYVVAGVVSALVFAAGHLPALANAIDLDAVLVTRTLALNAAAGIVYAWLFWRSGLEPAMLAHAATHAGFAILRAMGVA